MTFPQAFITKKTEEILEYLSRAEQNFVHADEEILANYNLLHTTERLLQLIVDTSIDINEYLIKELNLPVSDDYQGTFKILAENKILPEAFATKIAPVVGLRNRIVHRYDELDRPLFLATFRKNLGDFKEYLKLITEYTQK